MTTSKTSDLESFAQDREKLLRWMRGNQAAAVFAEQLLYVSHLWDDLIDRDVQRTPAQIKDCLLIALVELPLNPFYVKHFGELHPLIISTINDWHTANVMEQSKDSHDLDIAYTLRCNILSVVVHCTFIIGGREWAATVGPEIRRYGQRHSLAEYKEEFNA